MHGGRGLVRVGLFTRFDLTVLVAEPTRKSIGVYRQWREYAAGYDVALRVVGNKVLAQDDVAFLRDQVGDDLLAWIGQEPAIRAMEQGRPFDLADLGQETSSALTVLHAALDARVKDSAGTPIRPPSSTSRTLVPGQTRLPGSTWQPRSIPTSRSPDPVVFGPRELTGSRPMRGNRLGRPG